MRVPMRALGGLGISATNNPWGYTSPDQYQDESVAELGYNPGAYGTKEAAQQLADRLGCKAETIQYGTASMPDMEVVNCNGQQLDVAQTMDLYTRYGAAQADAMIRGMSQPMNTLKTQIPGAQVQEWLRAGVYSEADIAALRAQGIIVDPYLPGSTVPVPSALDMIQPSNINFASGAQPENTIPNSPQPAAQPLTQTNVYTMSPSPTGATPTPATSQVQPVRTSQLPAIQYQVQPNQVTNTGGGMQAPVEEGNSMWLWLALVGAGAYFAFGKK